jgi:hypothetical protein
MTMSKEKKVKKERGYKHTGEKGKSKRRQRDKQ